jgi:hypothetical protein
MRTVSGAFGLDGAHGARRRRAAVVAQSHCEMARAHRGGGDRPGAVDFRRRRTISIIFIKDFDITVN